jgi:LysM repeat protein
MNFWSDSVKLSSPSQNENFYFDIDTPRGHFFTILNFVPHDYANLDAILRRKLETIVESFDSVAKFSADLFLGFAAREINNFLHDLGKQSPGPELFSSAALCFISGDQLAYFLCGDAKVSILDSERLHSLPPLPATELLGPDSGIDTDETQPSERIDGDELGVRQWNAPLTNSVSEFTLDDDDVVLITTGSAGAMIEQPESFESLQRLRLPDAKSICDEVMETGIDEGTVLVISGPFHPFVDLSVKDLNETAVALESSLDVVTSQPSAVPDLMEKALEAQLEQRINPQIDELKEALSRKANSIDVLELNEILKSLGLVLAGKADTNELLALQKDVLKLRIARNESHPIGSEVGGSPTPRPISDANASVLLTDSGHDDSHLFEDEDTIAETPGHVPRQTFFGLKTAAVVFVVAIGAAFIGAWLQSRVLKKNPEVWAVKTSGNQIWINRMDQGGQGNVTLNLAAPVKSRGEQTFSSFADVKSYVDTITSPQSAPDQMTQMAQQPQTVDHSQPAESVRSAVAKADDLVKPQSQVDKKVTKSPELNTTASTKPRSRTAKLAAPPTSVPATAASLKRDRRVLVNPVASTSQIKVGAGDTLERLARRYKTTPAELRKLNPRINERNVIQPNQKILVPAPQSLSDAKTRRAMLVKQAH